MITKEQFCKIISNIQKQQKIDNQVSDVLELVCDSYVIYGTSNLYLESLLSLLCSIIDPNDHWISWWLWEDVEKVIYTGDSDDKIDISTSELLYDFLIESLRENNV